MEHTQAHVSLFDLSKNLYPETFLRLLSHFGASFLCPCVITTDMVFGIMDLIVGARLDAIVTPQAHQDYHTRLHGNKATGNIKSSVQAHGNVFVPVRAHPTQTVPTKDNPVVAVIGASIGYDSLLVDILPNGIRGIRVVLSNTCNHTYTYELNGNEVRLCGCEMGRVSFWIVVYAVWSDHWNNSHAFGLLDLVFLVALAFSLQRLSPLNGSTGDLFGAVGFE